MEYLNHEAVLSILPDRKADSHKGDYGKILLLCGSRGYTGAAALAAMGALRSGAGLVYLAVPESIYAIEACKLTEAIVLPLPDEGGTIAMSALPEIRRLLPKMDAVLIGCGLGQSEGTRAVLETVLREFSGPVVVDADGINLLAKHMDILRERHAPTILTPHAGEFVRIGGDNKADRVSETLRFAMKYGCILLLKGHETVISDGKETYVNQTGNPGMAVGGSGDVLSGIIVSLLGQGVKPLDATAAAAWLHGRAGDLAAERLGECGMIPSDMVDELPRLLK